MLNMDLFYDGQMACREITDSIETSFDKGLVNLESKLKGDGACDGLTELELALRAILYLTRPTGADFDKRFRVIEHIKSIVCSSTKIKGMKMDLRAEVCGSFVNGLFLPDGDLDLAIFGSAEKDGNVINIADLPPRKLHDIMFYLKAKMIEKKVYNKVFYLHRARIPLLECFHSGHQIECDITIGSSNGEHKSTAIAIISSVDWRFQALVRLVKVWASKYDINDAASGTLNSFSWTLLCIHHLQTRLVPILPRLKHIIRDTKIKVNDNNTKLLDYNDENERASILRNSWNHAVMWRTSRPENTESVTELFVSFVYLMRGLVDRGYDGLDRGYKMGSISIDTWDCCIKSLKEQKAFFSVNDPFESNENCARAVRHRNSVEKISGAIEETIKIFESNKQNKKHAFQVSEIMKCCFPENLFERHQSMRIHDSGKALFEESNLICETFVNPQYVANTTSVKPLKQNLNANQSSLLSEEERKKRREKQRRKRRKQKEKHKEKQKE